MIRRLSIRFEADAPPGVGSGVRRVLDLSTPRMKRPELLYVPTMTRWRADPDVLRGAVEIPLEPRKLSRRIKKTVRERQAMGLAVPAKVVKRVLRELKGEPT